MSTKKLYALTEREAAVLRARDPRWTDSAQRATPDPLTPIDTDAAIERMARAAFNARYETESFTWAKAGLFRKSYREDARAALAALLGGERE